MGMLSQPWRERRLPRLILIAFISSVSVAAVLFALPWIGLFITPSVLRKATIAFLVGLEVAYGVALAAVLAGTTICCALLWRARRIGSNWHRPARGLLLCVFSLLAIGSAELTLGLRRLWLGRADSSMNADGVLPEKFVEPARDGGLTLAVLGESSAFGTPFDRWFSVGKIVAWQLERAIPGQKVSVEMFARPGDALKGQYRKLAGLARRPDALIVYCGHNELSDGIPWSHKVVHYADERPSIFRRIDELAGRLSPACRLIRETADRFRSAVIPPPGLFHPLVDSPSYSPADYTARLAGFRRRLEALASYCDRIGALAILVVPPANDAGFEPSRSFLPAQTTRAAREAFTREFLAARSVEKSNPARAVELYRSLLESQPGFAETHYRLGCLLENAGAWDDAYEQFVKARDLDGLPMRCVTEFQNAYREVAARHACVLVDGQALFHAIGPHGLLDDHLFVDAMHPSLQGHIALAQAILDALHARQAWGWPRGAPAPNLDPALCASHFGLQASGWKIVAEGGHLFQYGSAGLRYDPSQRRAKMRAFEEAMKRLAAGEAPESLGLPNVGVPAAPGGEVAGSALGNAKSRD
jgi:tetratricopeptide (TPR) repeat protein